MKLLSQNKIIIVGLLLHYVLIGLVVGLLHNHEEDLKFHDNCPACQWEIQSQSRDTALLDVVHLLQLHQDVSTHLTLSHDSIIQSQTYFDNDPSRAPPVSS